MEEYEGIPNTLKNRGFCKNTMMLGQIRSDFLNTFLEKLAHRVY